MNPAAARRMLSAPDKFAMRRKRHILRMAGRPESPEGTGLSNLLLAALPPEDVQRLRHALDVIPLPLKQFLHRPGDVIEYVYFPGGGFCSELTVLESGEMVEVATIGREGMVGIFAAKNGHVALSAAMVQAESEICYRLPVDVFRSELERGGRFSEIVTRYTHAHVAFIMQSTACNAVHTVEQRLARWFLMAHDRVGRDEFPLTQEFVAMMLGVTRPTVTIVAGTLQKAGLITYRRGTVTILDREKLGRAACECYRVGTDLLLAVTDPRHGPK
jgi:CRP-like cAMP-binding protein